MAKKKKKYIKKTKKKRNIKKKTSNRNNTKITNNISKEKQNKKSYKFNIIYFLIAIFLLFVIFYLVYTSATPKVTKIYLDNDTLNISFSVDSYKIKNKIYCYITSNEESPSIDSKNWFLSKNGVCSSKIDLNKKYYAYLKNESNNIIEVDLNNYTKVSNLDTKYKTIYLAKGSYDDIEVTYEVFGANKDVKIEYLDYDKELIDIDKNGRILGLKHGNTSVNINVLNESIKIDVIVTPLITKRPSKGFDFNKKYLACKKYSENDNQVLDDILKYKIEKAGYKTRASVVEAARFLTLDFPYRIDYFYENGRQTTNKVDGEGRYYHLGLYLSESKYKTIKGSKKGPKIWGCSLYSKPAKRNMSNGLDCSGFVSWALLNGGFDVKDVGAGWSNNKDLTDYGTVKKLTTTLSKSNKIKVGDLLHSEAAGGHIGIIVGIDKNYYYVAQALWYNTKGVIITKYKKDKLSSSFPHVVLMDKYYKEDGNLTNIWW